MVLNLHWNIELTSESFFTNKTNQSMLQWIKHSDWKQTILIGPAKSGKTHLSNIWSDLNDSQNIKNNIHSIDYSKPILVDQIELFSNQDIFHILFNSLTYKTRVLWTCSNLKYIEKSIPDIKSRFNAITHLNIPKPNEEICINIMKKIFEDFGLNVKSDSINYLMKRIIRSYESIYKTAIHIHEQCLISQRAPSLPFIISLFS